jgi:hypothetical protein
MPQRFRRETPPKDVTMRTPARRLLLHYAASAAFAATAALLLGGAAASGEGLEFPDPSVVRLLTLGAVLTEDDSTGATLRDDIMADFEAQTGYEVVVTQGNIDLFDQARFGGADIVMAHLTQPTTQARIRAFRVPQVDGPIFRPAGNQNDN